MIDEMGTKFERAVLAIEIFNSVDALEYPSEATDQVVELFLDRLDYEDPFVASSRFVSIDWGRQYGRGFFPGALRSICLAYKVPVR